MTPEEYVSLLSALLSRDPVRVRAANRLLFGLLIEDDVLRDMRGPSDKNSQADLVLARAAQV